MYIQKSSAYSTAVNTLVRGNRPGVDRQRPGTDPTEPVDPGRKPSDSQAPVSRTVQEFARVGHDRIQTRSIDPRKLLELNPKLDRRTQTAINSYETLQYQGESEERESVSRLLGIDLYV